MQTNAFFAGSAFRMGASVIVLLGLCWAYLGPGSQEHTIHNAAIEDIDRDEGTTTVHFFAQSFPRECADPNPQSFGFAAVSLADDTSTLSAGMFGAVRLRVEEHRCVVLSFTPTERASLGERLR